VAQVDVALGPQSTLDRALRELRARHQPLGHTVNELLTTREEIRDAVAAYTAIGADEVLLSCWSPDPDQVGRLADAVFPPEGDWPGVGE
jgi:hypothetical protein